MAQERRTLLCFMFSFNPNAAELISPSFLQISTQAGWLRPWTLTSWWSLGRHKAMSCRPTARCPNTPWTSGGSSSPPQSTSSLVTTTQSGAFRRSMRTKWPAWGIWTGRRLRCGEAGAWSAPTTLWFTRPSDRRWAGTSAAELDRRIGVWIWFYWTKRK